MKGIDISMHNGSIDFKKVKGDGFNIVIIKATEGVNYVDPLLNQYYEGAKSAGFNIGFYHFMSEKTSPTQQAIDFWKHIKDKKFNIMPTLDIETNKMGRTRIEISNRCLEFLDKFKALSGMKCMIYTGAYFGRDLLDDRVKKYKGWIAHYGVSKPIDTGFEVVGHQYTSKGRVNGINGNVDLDTFKEQIFLNRKENSTKLKSLVVYNDGPDQRAAEYLADFLQCPTISNSRKFNYSCVEHVYAVGRSREHYTSYLKTLISGRNRYDTMQKVLDFIKRHKESKKDID